MGNSSVHNEWGWIKDIPVAKWDNDWDQNPDNLIGKKFIIKDNYRFTGEYIEHIITGVEYTHGLILYEYSSGYVVLIKSVVQI